MRPGALARRAPHVPLGGIAKSFILVGGATALGQGALILASPILTRLYSPEAFGLLSVYSGVLNVLLAVSSLRFDMAIPLADDGREAVHLLALSTTVAFGASVILTIILVLWGPALASVLGASELVTYLWLLPIALFTASAAQAIGSWAVYHRSFPALGRVRAIQGVAQAAFQIGLGVLRVGPAGLIVGDVLGRIVGTEQLARPLIAALRGTRVVPRVMLERARARWPFARIMTVASLLNALALQIPLLLIPAMFDLASTGQYFLAYRLLILPASFVGAAVSSVFFGEASHRRDDPQRLRNLAHNVAVSLLVFAIPTYTAVLVAGPEMITFVFGSEWEEAGLYAQLLAPGLMLWAVASPISSLLLVGRRERESLGFTAAELAVKVGTLMLGLVAGSLAFGIAALSVATFVLSVVGLWRILRAAGSSVRHLIRPGLRIAAITLPSALLLLILARSVSPVLVVLAAGAAWAITVVIAARILPETRALISGSHD